MFTIERIPGPFASLYEKAARLVIESYYWGMAQEVGDFLESGMILDLGTGPGYLPIEIVKRSRSVRAVGIDLSHSLIKMARENADKAGVAERVHFEVGNAGQLHFPDDAFDMVISTGMLHSLKDPVKVLRECHRVLKHGREGWFLDPARVCSQMDRQKWKASLSFLERFMNMIFALYVHLNPPNRYTKIQIAAMVSATPFKGYTIQKQNGEFFIRLKK